MPSKHSLSSPVIAELNLDALRANLAKVRKLAPGSKILAVIKADGYGHGLLRVARALTASDGFAVARVEEGIQLRRAGIAHRIVVLQGYTNQEEYQAHLTHRLEPVIHSLSQLDLLAGHPPQGLRPWLKLDTGMHRLGLSQEAFDVALSHLAQCKPQVMTHLACADETRNPFTSRQLAVFEQIVRPLELPISIANSAAILAWPRTHADWVRPGLMLYGISPFTGRTGTELGLQPVMTLKSRIIAIKSIPDGAAVGYGGAWTARRPTRLGIVSAGYGDGYPREITPGTQVLIGHERVPVIGRVSMDMLTVDLTDFPGITEGRQVTLWGEDLPVEEIATRGGTIPYTLVCGVTPRVHRIETGTHYGTNESRL